MTIMNTAQNTPFSQRLREAMSADPHVPPQEYGRVTWLRAVLEDRVNLDVSVNTAHKWLNGLAVPRQAKIYKIAEALNVDPVYLAMGGQPVATPKEMKAAVRHATGAVTLVAGLLETSGVGVAYPEANDKAAKEGNIHFYSIIQGRQLRMTVVLSKGDKDELVFEVPRPVEGNRVIGVVPAKNGVLGGFTLLDITDAPSKDKGGSLEVRVQREKGNKFSAPKISTLDHFVG